MKKICIVDASGKLGQYMDGLAHPGIHDVGPATIHHVSPGFHGGRNASSVFITWLFIHARQSILVAGSIPHAVANAWGDAIGPMTWINAGVLVLRACLLLLAGGLRGAAGPRLAPARPAEVLP